MRATRLDTSDLRAWRATKPQTRDVSRAVSQVLAGVPRQWHGAMRHLGDVRKDAPEWLACLDALDTLRAFEQAHGDASRWNSIARQQWRARIETIRGWRAR